MANGEVAAKTASNIFRGGLGSLSDFIGQATMDYVEQTILFFDQVCTRCLNKDPETGKFTPVSYTHLTLPTIYSV